MKSILDTDLYKLTQGQFALQKYPRASAKYRFVNRNLGQKFDSEMRDAIEHDIQQAGRLYLTQDEESFLRGTCRYLQPWYIDWLKQFRLDPRQIDYGLTRTEGDEDDQLVMTINGPWSTAIYWEVPLLAIIAKQIMRKQRTLDDDDFALLGAKAHEKGVALRKGDCRFVDFGTRRRFSYDVHDTVLKNLIKGGGDHFLGTSNVHFAHKHGIKPIGTMAHELIQAMSGLVGLRHANRFALEAWNDVYQGDLGIALTDTFGSSAFWGDFTGLHARLFDGIRQDSGDPVKILNQAIKRYELLRIDPRTKAIIFSDSLTVDKACYLQMACRDRMKSSYGIGTHLTNDIPGTTPANIVIKLVQIDDVSVVKLSDDPGKAIGDPKAIDVAKWTFSEGEYGP